jgi:hypothetical protein
MITFTWRIWNERKQSLFHWRLYNTQLSTEHLTTQEESFSKQ